MKMKDLILVGVDDRIIEPPDLFSNHLSQRHLSDAPCLVRDITGRQVWVFEDRVVATAAQGCKAGRPREHHGLNASNLEDIRPGAYLVEKRIEDMNVNGVRASLNFPTFPGSAGEMFWKARDRSNAARLIRAYNDWYIDEWCAAAPDRFIPNALLPLWDIDLTLAEIRRVLDKKCYSVSFPDNPSAHELPSLHNPIWYPLWRLCNDAGVVLNCHLGTGHAPAPPSDDSPIDAWLTALPLSRATNIADWLSASFWMYYPNLKLVLSQSDIGWIPYFLERADLVFQQHRAWTNANYGGRIPSEIFRAHMVTSFIDDAFGLRNSHSIGTNMIVWQCDYPRSNSAWPNTPERLWESLSSLPDRDIRKISHENVMRLWRFDIFALAPPEDCTVAALRQQARHVDTTPAPLPYRPGNTPQFRRRLTVKDLPTP